MTTRKTPPPTTFRTNIWLARLGSVRLTLACLILGMIIVLVGTLAQVKMGTFAAQKVYFNSWILFASVAGTKIPVFPGGLSIGALWAVNLIASFIIRFQFRREDIGIYLTHFGLTVLLLGQFLTQTFAYETQMPIEVGQSSNYSFNPFKTELVFIKSAGSEFDQVTSIPESFFNREGAVKGTGLPFEVVIRKYIRNAKLGMSKGGAQALATQGIGTRISIEELAPILSDEEPNTVTAYVEVLEGAQSRGIWLVSAGLGALQTVTVQGMTYQIGIRPKRTYFPFTLALKEFRHDRYPGTDIPKNFSSLVQLSNPETNESRSTLIYMNHPLRYAGYTFFQASFGEGDRLSVFQVVKNPAAITPYLSCALIALGLVIQFMSHLLVFLRKRA